MIAPGAELKIYIATRPVDFRCGHDGLASKVQEMLGLDPFSGAAFVFRSKRMPAPSSTPSRCGPKLPSERLVGEKPATRLCGNGGLDSSQSGQAAIAGQIARAGLSSTLLLSSSISLALPSCCLPLNLSPAWLCLHRRPFEDRPADRRDCRFRPPSPRYLRVDTTFNESNVQDDSAWAGDPGQGNRYRDYIITRSRLA